MLRPCKLTIISADATPVYFANMLIDVWTFSVSRCYHGEGRIQNKDLSDSISQQLIFFYYYYLKSIALPRNKNLLLITFPIPFPIPDMKKSMKNNNLREAVRNLS